MVPIIIAIVYFGFFSIFFGLMARKKEKLSAGTGDGADFFTAQGQLGWFAVMTAFLLAPLGGGHTTSLYESQSGMGVAVVWWGILIGGIFVPIFMLWFAPMFRKLKVVTFPQALDKIFGPNIKIFNASVAPAAWMAIAISELLGTATAVYALCGGRIGFAPGCVLIAAALMLVYILLGGMLQASYMSIINAIFLIVGSYVAVVYVGLKLDGGYQSVVASYAAQGLEWHTDMFHLTPAVLMNCALPAVILHVFAVSSEHMMYQPMIAAKSNREIRKGALIAGVLNTACCIPFVVLGVTATSIAAIAEKAPILSVPELALTLMPDVLIGVLMVALLCALLSTGSGLILSTSHVVADDIICPIIGKKPGDRGYKAISRVLIVVFTVVATIPALRVESLIITLFFWSFSLSMPIFVNYFIGMVWKVNRTAAWINLIASTAVNFWWTFACPSWAGIFSLSFWPVAFTTVVLGVVLNLIMPGEKSMLTQIKEQKSSAGA